MISKAEKVDAQIPVAAVVGPTASGKSGLAVELALRCEGEVVSADSMQIYTGMSIGTAKPTVDEMRGVPHHLIDFVDPQASFSVADYVKLAAQCVADIHARGKLPILAGGTGLYVRSFLQNLQFTEEDRNDALRASLKKRAEEEGTQALMDELRRIDPESAARLHPNNLGRVIRALEIYYTTGSTMTQQIERSRTEPSPYHVCMIGLDFLDRENLYARINARVDKMMADGLEEEARQVLGQRASTARQAIGYKEWAPYFQGEISREEVAENIKRETRRYAKRQLTWFRREENIHWLHVDAYPDSLALVSAAQSILDTWRCKD